MDFSSLCTSLIAFCTSSACLSVRLGCLQFQVCLLLAFFGERRLIFGAHGVLAAVLHTVVGSIKKSVAIFLGHSAPLLWTHYLRGPEARSHLQPCLSLQSVDRGLMALPQ